MRLRTAHGRAVAIENKLIVENSGSFDLDIDLGDVELYPGLINAHDHLHRNHYGRRGHPPYRNAYDWGDDIHVRDAEVIARGRELPRRDALLFGARKNLLSGVTTVVHHDPWEPDFERDFPIRVAQAPFAHSLRRSELRAAPTRNAPLWLHLAEGVDEECAAEVSRLEELGWLGSGLVAIHAVGVTSGDVQRLRAIGAAIVWCPTSNHFLFGRTAPPELLAEGIDVMVGSDSLLTADGSLLDEMRAARKLGYLDDERLIASVTTVPARRLGIPAPTLQPGTPADVIALRKPLLEAAPKDVALVLVGGAPRVAADPGTRSRFLAFWPNQT
jgi:cytosine/adenosine deaminase-related metal-dependent hydrolase